MSETRRTADQRIYAALARIQAGIWAMRDSYLESVLQRAEGAGDGLGVWDPPEPEVIGASAIPGRSNLTGFDESRVPRLPKVGGQVAVICIRGIIGQHRGGDYWADTFTETLDSQITMMVRNPAIGGIVLDIDSPGGIVYGVPELAETIRVASAVKPIYGVANGQAASAAYWLAASGSRIFGIPSAEAGSIGVWSTHSDFSKRYEEAGIKVTLVSAGEFKTEGNPFEPLTDAGKADMQASVDRYHEMFIADVALGRGISKAVVRESFGRGRMLGSEAAKSLGMIDGIATVSEVVAGIMTPKEKGSRLAMANATIAIEEAK